MANVDCKEHIFKINPILTISNWLACEIDFSRTPDLDFRCFYPCEIFLSHTPIPALGKDKKRTAARWPYVDP